MAFVVHGITHFIIHFFGHFLLTWHLWCMALHILLYTSLGTFCWHGICGAWHYTFYYTLVWALFADMAFVVHGITHFIIHFFGHFLLTRHLWCMALHILSYTCLGTFCWRGITHFIIHFFGHFLLTWHYTFYHTLLLGTFCWHGICVAGVLVFCWRALGVSLPASNCGWQPSTPWPTMSRNTNSTRVSWKSECPFE